MERSETLKHTKTFDPSAQLEFIYQLLETLRSFSDYKELFSYLATNLDSLIACDVLSVLLIPDDHIEVYSYSQRPTKKPLLDELLLKAKEALLELNVFDVRLKEVKTYAETLGEGESIERLASSIQLPLIVGAEEKLLGILSIASEQTEAYNPDQLRFLNTIAQHAAHSIYYFSNAISVERQRLSALFDVIPIGLVLLDKDQQLSLANPTGQTLLKDLDASFADKTLKTLNGEALEPLLAKELGDPIIQQNLTRKGPNPRSIEITSAFIPFGPEAGGHILAFRDHSRRIKAEQNLALSQKQLAAIFENNSEAIFLLNSQGQIENLNPSAYLLLNQRKTELLQQTIWDLPYWEESNLQSAEYWQECLSDERISIGHASLKFGNLVKKIDFRIHPQVIDDLHLLSCRDVTERQVMLEQLEHSETLYKTLIHNFPKGTIYLLDRDLNFILAGGKGLAENGLSEEYLIGKTPLEVFPQFSEEHKKQYQEALKGKTLSSIRVLQGKSYETLILPLPASNGQIETLLVLSLDISKELELRKHLMIERARLNKRVIEQTKDLSQMNGQLLKAVKLKDEFLASMSHELRTPLNAILNMSESLTEQLFGSLNEKQLSYLDTIYKSGSHLLELINDILDLSKIEAGRFELEFSQSNIAELCQSSLLLVKEQALRQQLSLELSLPPDLPQALLDTRRVKQILVNLLSNAVKFTPQNGKVGLEVRLNQEQTQLSFCVWDTGIGIAEEKHKQIFESFTQIDGSLSRQYNGTGLGLALVERLTKLHGGCVSLTSKPNQGSRFTVNLPFQAPPKAVAKPVAEPARLELDSPLKPKGTPWVTSRKTDKEKVLLIDDTTWAIKALSDYLKAMGYEMFVENNAQAGLLTARQEQPDLILMDVQMPDLNGIEATKILRKDARFVKTPIIALTALAMPGDKESCLRAGMNDYLSKPVQLKEMAKLIAQHLAAAKHSQTKA